MTAKIMKAIDVSDLANHLGLAWSGENVSLYSISALPDSRRGSLSFSRGLLVLNPVDGSAVIAPIGSGAGGGAVIYSENPRLDFARALLFIRDTAGFLGAQKESSIHESAQISEYSDLAERVSIGARTIVERNVVIHNDVNIGSDCLIKSGSVIGSSGFGFERDESYTPIPFLQLGGVNIGSRVEIGNLTVVDRGTLSDTLIEDDVKIDDRVHVGHNVFIGKCSLIVGGTTLCGSVSVGAYSWVGPGSTVMQKVALGEKSLVGMGSNVLKDVEAGATVAGNPAKPI